MTLSGRMWLVGAALPVAVMAVVLGVSDQLFDFALERSVDQALLAQAAAESVSPFHGIGVAPHLHMSFSPLAESVRPFAPEGALFGPDGHLVTRYPPRADAPPETLTPRPLDAPPAFSTQLEGALRFRRLAVTLKAPDEQLYTLRLSASLEQIDRSAQTFHKLFITSTLVTGALLVLAQGWQGRRLRRRLRSLQWHLEAVHSGDLDQLLPPESENDEIAELRRVLAKATAQLKHAHAAQERLLADAAHELRTPLTLMRTSLDLALRRKRSGEELKQALRDAREECERLALLANRLLDTVSVGKGDFRREPGDLVLLARESVATVVADAEARGLSVRLDAPSEAKARIHAGSIRQALDNLLSNAFKVAPPGSVVTVRLAPAKAGWALSVRDEGPGIAAAERDLVFEPFHRARGGQPGTGLGLTIVREVARHHGGRAYVASVTSGAEVVLLLPADT